MTNGHASSMHPINASRRIAAIDVLRGLALLGMLVVHFHERSSDPGGFDDMVRILVWRLVESKSHGTFAVLFGAGFALQLRRADAGTGDFAARYLRRLAVLACFGFAAHALFGFNVLLGYAAWGVALLLIRSWSTRALLATALLCAMSVSLYQLALTSYARRNAGTDGIVAMDSARRSAAVEVNSAVRSAQAHDSYGALVKARLRHMAWFYRQPFFFLPGVTLTLFIVGFLFVRHGVFEQIHTYRKPLGLLAAFGVISWLADNWLLGRWGISTLGVLRDQWLTFTYLAGAILLFEHFPRVVARLGPIANAGRMALTNYLIQIAALDVVFSGYAVGLGQVRPLVGLGAALTCFAVQAGVSSLWLAHFRFGPAEWLWRTLTYRQIQPLRRVAAPAAQPEASRLGRGA
jgi:uncharacterized protein